MWAEVATSKTEIHVTSTASELMWSCNVITVDHEGEKSVPKNLPKIIKMLLTAALRQRIYIEMSVKHSWFFVCHDQQPCQVSSRRLITKALADSNLKCVPGIGAEVSSTIFQALKGFPTDGPYLAQLYLYRRVEYFSRTKVTIAASV